MISEFVAKADERKVLKPLTDELWRLVDLRFGNRYGAWKALNWPSSTPVYRALEGASSNYILLTKLITLCGLSPNEGAALAGLYVNPDQEVLSPEERALVHLYREQTPANQKTFLTAVKVLASTWRGAPEPTQEEEALVASQEPEERKKPRKRGIG